MSASQDKSQKVTFIFSKKGAPVLKTDDAKNPSFVAVNRAVEAYRAPHFITPERKAPTEAPASSPSHEEGVRPGLKTDPAALTHAEIAQAIVTNPALESLKDNLKTLHELHNRLRFMLQELEEIVKE